MMHVASVGHVWGKMCVFFIHDLETHTHTHTHTHTYADVGAASCSSPALPELQPPIAFLSGDIFCSAVTKTAEHFLLSSVKQLQTPQDKTHEWIDSFGL